MENELVKELKSTSEKIINLLSSFDEKVFNKIPFEGSWTAAQVADHLLISFEGIYHLLTADCEKTDRKPDKMVAGIKKLFLDYKIKMKSMEGLIPTNSPMEKTATIAKLKEKLGNMQHIAISYDVTDTCTSFEFPGEGFMTRLEWFYFVIYHTQRHTHQLENIFKILNGVNMKPIKKTVEINAAIEEVWSVLTEDKSTRVWYNEFSEGSHADTNWEVGSKVIFKDNSGKGMIAKVIANKVNEELGVEYTGELLADGTEDYDSPAAKAMQGGKEVYHLSENKGITTLHISSDMDEKYFDMMSASWDKAIAKIKELAEGK